MKLKAEGSIPTLEDEKRYHNLLSLAERVVFGTNRFDIVLCTCNEAASNRVSKHVHPHQCIVDECGFAIEPDVMIPLQHSQHVVLIGDHKQLQPVIKNRCVCVYTCLCTYVCTYVCTQCAHVCMCVYKGMYVCMYKCVHICVLRVCVITCLTSTTQCCWWEWSKAFSVWTLCWHVHQSARETEEEGRRDQPGRARLHATPGAVQNGQSHSLNVYATLYDMCT